MSDHLDIKAPEVTNAAPGTLPTDARTSVQVTPTQVRRPWRSTARTVFQALIGLCVLAPILVEAAGVDVEQLPWLGLVLLIAAGVTRVMALPGVEQWLRRFLPFLAAAPGSSIPVEPGQRSSIFDERGATDVRASSAVLLVLALAMVLVALVR